MSIETLVAAGTLISNSGFVAHISKLNAVGTAASAIRSYMHVINDKLTESAIREKLFRLDILGQMMLIQALRDTILDTMRASESEPCTHPTTTTTPEGYSFIPEDQVAGNKVLHVALQLLTEMVEMVQMDLHAIETKMRNYKSSWFRYTSYLDCDAECCNIDMHVQLMRQRKTDLLMVWQTYSHKFIRADVHTNNNNNHPLQL